MSESYAASITLFLLSNLIAPVVVMMLFSVDSTDGFFKDFGRVWIGLWVIILFIAAAIGIMYALLWSFGVLFYAH